MMPVPCLQLTFKFKRASYPGIVPGEKLNMFGIDAIFEFIPATTRTSEHLVGGVNGKPLKARGCEYFKGFPSSGSMDRDQFSVLHTLGDMPYSGKRCTAGVNTS